jgi:hypothetical protein
MELLTEHIPRQKRKTRTSKVTTHPAFQQLAAEITSGRNWAGIERALSFEESDKAELGVDNPARIAADAIRKIIREQNRPLQVRKYRVGKKWFVVVRGATTGGEDSAISKAS